MSTEDRVVFFDQSSELVTELQDRDIPAVQTTDPVEELSYDWIVSPANCHGHMDGGFDLYLAQRLSIDPKTGWRPYIDPADTVDLGEPYLEPGEVVRWPDKDLLIAATVRSPVSVSRRPAEDHHIRECLRKLNRIAESEDARIACPGLGTGYGGVTAREFASFAEQTIRSEVNANV